MSNATSIFSSLEPTPTARTSDNKQRCIGRRLAGFFHQLRERKVCRAAAAYAIFSWIMLQLGEIVFPTLGLPAWTLTLVVVVAIAGFPIAMILAWVLQWTDNGLVIDVPQNPGQSQSSKLDVALNLVLIIAATALSAELIGTNLIAQASPAGLAGDGPAAIALIPLVGENLAGNSDAKTIEQLLRYELVSTQSHPLRLIAGISHDDAFAIDDDNVALNWIVEGSVHSDNGQIRLLLHLVELPDRRYVDSWSLVSDPDSPTAAHDLAKTAVASVIDYLSTTGNAGNAGNKGKL